jgi:hypothetical protein
MRHAPEGSGGAANTLSHSTEKYIPIFGYRSAVLDLIILKTALGVSDTFMIRGATMKQRQAEIRAELDRLYEENRKFVQPTPADAPGEHDLSGLAEFVERRKRIRELEDELVGQQNHIAYRKL